MSENAWKKEKINWKNRFKQAFSRHKPSQIWPKYAKFAKVFALGSFYSLLEHN